MPQGVTVLLIQLIIFLITLLIHSTPPLIFPCYDFDPSALCFWSSWTMPYFFDPFPWCPWSIPIPIIILISNPLDPLLRAIHYFFDPSHHSRWIPQVYNFSTTPKPSTRFLSGASQRPTYYSYTFSNSAHTCLSSPYALHINCNHSGVKISDWKPN